MGGHASLLRLNQLIFPIILLAFLCLGLLGIDHSCLDAADSAYVISSDAIARGLMPYRDFLAAHPPLLYMAGAPLAKLGLGVLPFRVFSLLVTAVLGLAVWRLAWGITRDSKTAILAGAFTLFAPLGLYFTKSFLNDSLVSLFAVCVLLLLSGRSRWRFIAAGVICVLGMMTKLTFLPVFVFTIVFIFVYRRNMNRIFLAVSIGGSILVTLAVQLLTQGAYLGNILGSQASKGYSFTNFYEGLHRIWQIDWPLLVPAALGIWFVIRMLDAKEEPAREYRFLLLGWLVAAALPLFTLAAEGHDTNLFLTAEPAIALFAAFGIAGLANKRSVTGIVLAAAWLILAVPLMTERDSGFFFRSNSGDVATIVTEARNRSTDCQPVLIPGCYALEADRPVTLNFFDQFLWEEKYKRGDDAAVAMMDDLRQELSEVKPPLAVFAENQPTLDIVGPELDARYTLDWQSEVWPPVTMWVPQAEKKPG